MMARARLPGGEIGARQEDHADNDITALRFVAGAGDGRLEEGLGHTDAQAGPVTGLAVGTSTAPRCQTALRASMASSTISRRASPFMSAIRPTPQASRSSSGRHRPVPSSVFRPAWIFA